MTGAAKDHPTPPCFSSSNPRPMPDRRIPGWSPATNSSPLTSVPGANVILSKQLMVEAVERIITGQSSRGRLEREQILAEMTAVLETDSERIGWGVPSESAFRDPEVKQTFLSALTAFHSRTGRAGDRRRAHLPDRTRSASPHRSGHADDQFLRRGGGPLRHLLAPPGRHQPDRPALSSDVGSSSNPHLHCAMAPPSSS